ncbi:MAG: hypothetical protein ACTHNI_09900 [Cellulosimicrobium cellulans]
MSHQPEVGEYRWVDGRLLQWDGQRWVVPLDGPGPDQHPVVDDLLDDLATPSDE